MNSAPSPRQRLIRLIHVAKRDLRLDDDSYRAMLQQLEGRDSAADLTVPQLERVLEHMKRHGFKVRSKGSTKPMATDDQSSKIRALWLEMAHLGIVRDRSEHALGCFVKRMTGIDTLQWLTPAQSSKVIEELKKWHARAIRSV